MKLLQKDSEVHSKETLMHCVVDSAVLSPENMMSYWLDLWLYLVMHCTRYMALALVSLHNLFKLAAGCLTSHYCMQLQNHLHTEMYNASLINTV